MFLLAPIIYGGTRYALNEVRKKGVKGAAKLLYKAGKTFVNEFGAFTRTAQQNMRNVSGMFGRVGMQGFDPTKGFAGLKLRGKLLAESAQGAFVKTGPVLMKGAKELPWKAAETGLYAGITYAISPKSGSSKSGSGTAPSGQSSIVTKELINQATEKTEQRLEKQIDKLENKIEKLENKVEKQGKTLKNVKLTGEIIAVSNNLL